MIRVVMLVCSMSLIFACTGNQEAPKKEAPAAEAKKEAPAEKPAEAAAEPAAPASAWVLPTDANAVVDDGTVVTVNLGSTDQMKFTFTQIDVAAGRKVKLTLTHTGKMPKAAMGHNFVLLQAGVDPAAFAAAGIAAKATDYIAPGSDDKVIAKTPLLGGGESATIEFDAPAAGTYAFVCTMPGHSSLMNGVLIVK